MMLRGVVIAFLFFCMGTEIFGQEWYKGTVTLTNQKVIPGEIAYWAGRDAIFLKSGDATVVFPAFRIRSFSFYDDEAEGERRFVTLLDSIGAATMYQFYEVVLEGPISVLRQQHAFWYSLHLETIDFDYFVMMDERLIPMSKFRRHVYPSLKRSSASIRDFARQNRINLFSINDTVELIEYYNNERSGVASLN
jgi:hypothetical protein